MNNQNKPSKQGNVKRRSIIALCALITVLVASLSIGGTLAYLMQVTPEVVNTFELGELGYKLHFEKNTPEARSEDDISNMPADKRGRVRAGSYIFEVPEIPALTGYQFLGWADEEGATVPNAAYESGNNYAIPVGFNENGKYDVNDNATTSKTVYAVWQPNTYSVKYNANGGTGTMANSTHTYDERSALSPNSFVKENYKFAGWSTSPNGEVAYADGHNNVWNWTAENGGVIELYAQWYTDKQYAITYHANDKDAYFSGQKEVHVEYKTHDSSYVIKTPDDLGATKGQYWIWTEWNTKPDGSGTTYLGTNEYNINAELDLYAIWAPKTAVTFGNTVFVNMANPWSDMQEGKYSFTVKCKTKSGADGIATPIYNLIPGEAYKLTFSVDFKISDFYTEDNHAYMFGTTIIDQYENYDTKLSIISREGVKVTSTYENMMWSTENAGKYNMFIEFVPTKETMYWFWETTDITDGVEMTYIFENFNIQIIDKPEPRVEFENLYVTYDTAPTTKNSVWGPPAGETVRHKNYFHTEQYDFDYLRYRHWGTDGHEKLTIPISGLTVGQNYTLSFSHDKSEANFYSNSDLHYGYTITEDENMSVADVYKSKSPSFRDMHDRTSDSVTFTATAETMYWQWGMGKIIDGTTSPKEYSWITLSDVEVSATSSAATVRRASVQNAISDVTVSGMESISAGSACVLTLSGANMPDILQVEINGSFYMMSLSGADAGSFADSKDATVKNDWITANGDGSYTLTIPAEKVTAGTRIIIMGYNVATLDSVTIGTFEP